MCTAIQKSKEELGDGDGHGYGRLATVKGSRPVLGDGDHLQVSKKKSMASFSFFLWFLSQAHNPSI